MDVSSKGLVISEYDEDIGSCICLLSPDHWKRAISFTCWDLTQNKNMVKNKRKCSYFHTEMSEVIKYLKILFYTLSSCLVPMYMPPESL